MSKSMMLDGLLESWQGRVRSGPVVIFGIEFLIEMFSDAICMRFAIVFSIVSLLSVPSLQAQQERFREPFVITPELKAVKDQLLADAKTQIHEPYQKDLATLNTQYLAMLDRLLANPQPPLPPGQLHQERDRIMQKKKVLSLDFDGTPPELVKLRQAYRKSLAAIEARAETAWMVMKEKYLKAADKLQPDPRAIQLIQKEWRLGAMTDLDFMPSSGKDRILGNWKITRSDGMEMEWKVTPQYTMVGYYNVETANGSGTLQSLSAAWKERLPGSEHDWIFTTQNEIRFEGLTPKQHPVLRICGERVRPWWDSP